MTELATRNNKIEVLEGFSIAIFDGFANSVDLEAHGLLAYGHTNSAAGSLTVLSC